MQVWAVTYKNRLEESKAAFLKL